MNELNIRQMEIGFLGVNAYLLWLDGREDALVIDPGDDIDNTVDMMLKAVGKKLTDIVLTHGHFDHMLSAAELAKKHGARIRIHPKDAHMLTDKKASLYSFLSCDMKFTPVEADALFPDADEWDCEICGIPFHGMRTPGHTKGSICLTNEARGVMFSGDTLFAQGCGRTDFPGGSEEEMTASLQKLLKMNEKLRVYPGHAASDQLGNIARCWRQWGLEF